jgi:hypothetical protein
VRHRKAARRGDDNGLNGEQGAVWCRFGVPDDELPPQDRGVNSKGFSTASTPTLSLAANDAKRRVGRPDLAEYESYRHSYEPQN